MDKIHESQRECQNLLHITIVIAVFVSVCECVWFCFDEGAVFENMMTCLYTDVIFTCSS